MNTKNTIKFFDLSEKHLSLIFNFLFLFIASFTSLITRGGVGRIRVGDEILCYTYHRYAQNSYILHIFKENLS